MSDERESYLIEDMVMGLDPDDQQWAKEVPVEGSEQFIQSEQKYDSHDSQSLPIKDFER